MDNSHREWYNIYFVQFLSSQQIVENPSDTESLEEIFGNMDMVLKRSGCTISMELFRKVKEGASL